MAGGKNAQAKAVAPSSAEITAEPAKAAASAEGGSIAENVAAAATLIEQTAVAGLHAEVVNASSAAFAAGEHAVHGALHTIETLLGELKHKIGEAEKVLEGEALAVLQKVKSFL